MNYSTFYQKNCQKALKNMVLGSGIRDPRSGIRDPEKTYSGSRIPDPGVKKHPIPDPGSRIRIRNTGSQSWWYFQPSFVNYCPSITFSLACSPPFPFPVWISILYTRIQCVGGGGGGYGGHRREGTSDR